jgi:D-cysteine desulfhydrase
LVLCLTIVFAALCFLINRLWLNNPVFEFPSHISLARLPTPIETLDRLSSRLAGPKLLVKRDDLTGTPLSGNKVRKLEFFAKAALDTGCDTLITCGAIQSNHARATAIAAARLGLNSYLVLREGADSAYEGNLILDKLVGARVKFITRQQYFQARDIMQNLARELADEGHTAYVIPEGGSNALGCMGYIQAVQEIKGQLEALGQTVDYIISPVGSGGTLAGLLLGVKLFKLDCRVIGINVSSTAKHHTKRVQSIITDTVRQFGLNISIDPSEIEIIDGYVGLGYAQSRLEEISFIKEVAQTEGLILDPVYSGKTMYGLATEIKKGRFKPGQTVLFIHTGGIFGLFANYLEEFWHQAFA